MTEIIVTIGTRWPIPCAACGKTSNAMVHGSITVAGSSVVGAICCGCQAAAKWCERDAARLRALYPARAGPPQAAPKRQRKAR